MTALFFWMILAALPKYIYAYLVVKGGNLFPFILFCLSAFDIFYFMWADTYDPWVLLAFSFGYIVLDLTAKSDNEL